MSDLSPKAFYQEALKREGFEADPAQAQAIALLEGLYQQLSARSGWLASLKKVLGCNTAIKGLYCWGDVGRGKTFLVDAFYHSLPFEQKCRAHFHRFINLIHDRLSELGGGTDPIKQIAAELSKQYRVICLDEFYVSDIADAMVFKHLLTGLFEQGVCMVFTSNIPPEKLYKNGLHRERFLPVIDQIEQHCQVFNLDGEVDHRLRALEKAQIFYAPIDDHTQSQMHACFESLAPDNIITEDKLMINHREIKTIMSSDDVVWCDFKVLCGDGRSQHDYVEMAKMYHALLLSNVPKMGAHNDNEARRFISLIDEFYDHNVKLIMSSEVDLNALYDGERLSFEFKRTHSRLQEMQSKAYLAKGHEV